MTGYRPLSIGLGIACAALGAFIALALREPSSIALPAPTPPAGQKLAVADPAEPKSFRLDPVKTYDAIAERPLFSPSRQPTKPPPPPRDDNTRRSLTGIVLTGVVIGPADKIALITSSKSPRPLRLIEGEKLEGWKLEKVMLDKIILSADDETAEISIWDKLKAAAAARKPAAR